MNNVISHNTRETTTKSLKHHKNMHGVTSLLFFIMITDIRENLVFILHTKQGHAY